MKWVAAASRVRPRYLARRPRPHPQKATPFQLALTVAIKSNRHGRNIGGMGIHWAVMIIPQWPCRKDAL
jgi:hypothetical protein